MPDGIEVSSDIEPIVELVAIAHLEDARDDGFARLRNQQAKGRAAVKQYATQLDRLYEDMARSGHNADWLNEAANIVRRSEEAQRERLRPGIEALKQKFAAYRAPRDLEVRRLIEESIAVGEAWLSLPAALHRKLSQLAAERHAAAQQIRRAQPVAGEIDYAGLTREIIARYPKILKALAE
jgi:chromosome segregation ATPase